MTEASERFQRILEQQENGLPKVDQLALTDIAQRRAELYAADPDTYERIHRERSREIGISERALRLAIVGAVQLTQSMKPIKVPDHRPEPQTILERVARALSDFRGQFKGTSVRQMARESEHHNSPAGTGRVNAQIHLVARAFGAQRGAVEVTGGRTIYHRADAGGLHNAQLGISMGPGGEYFESGGSRASSVFEY